MGVKVNKSDENAGGSVKKFIGVTNVETLCVNPDKATLEKIGIKVEKEPEYFSMGNDPKKPVPTLRVSFYVLKEIGEGAQTEKLISNISFFIEGRYNESKKGTVQVIDAFGKSTWVTDDVFRSKVSPHSWVDGGSWRKALVGEENLIKYIGNFANVGSGEDCSLDNMKYLAPWPDPEKRKKALALAPAKIKEEIQGIISVVNKEFKNKVKVLFYVRSDNEGKTYQDIFPYHTDRSWSKDCSRFHKELRNLAENSRTFFDNKEFGDLDLSTEKCYENQYAFKPFVETPASGSAPKASAEAMPSGDYPAEWDEPMGSEGDDTDPFA